MPGDEVDAAIAAADAAIAAIHRITGSQERLRAAGRLVDALRSRSDEAARIRHAEAVRIYEAEKLSLAALAGRIGVSKARADQIMRAARQQREAGDA